jgi:hypothetical protein
MYAPGLFPFGFLHSYGFQGNQTNGSKTLQMLWNAYIL